MTPNGVKKVREAIREVYERAPEILSPLEEFYKINVEERISSDEYWV